MLSRVPTLCGPCRRAQRFGLRSACPQCKDLIYCSTCKSCFSCGKVQSVKERFRTSYVERLNRQVQTQKAEYDFISKYGSFTHLHGIEVTGFKYRYVEGYTLSYMDSPFRTMDSYHSIQLNFKITCDDDYAQLMHIFDTHGGIILPDGKLAKFDGGLSTRSFADGTMGVQFTGVVEP